MKKLFLLSSISVFIGLMFLVFCTSQLYAAPPFPESDQPPFPGGLPSRLDALAACQGLPGDGYTDPSFGTLGHGPALNYTEPTPEDGTFTDENTGLMWEIKDVSGGIHDVDNSYTWTIDDGDLTDPDGTLFTVFLVTLNNTCDGAGVACATDTDCMRSEVCGFAGFRDWRIPNIKELQSIVDYSVSDPASSVPGETRLSPYWSATTRFGSTSSAWHVGFIDGLVLPSNKTFNNFARAVRP